MLRTPPRPPVHSVGIYIHPQNPSRPLRKRNKVGKPGPPTSEPEGASCPILRTARFVDMGFGLWGQFRLQEQFRSVRTVSVCEDTDRGEGETWASNR